ncbi:M24 family metallopeptidase [Alkaliphilus hydrothermalis]|uniref:Xaa-Pro aminopeptidase n=1 Tax=Alkaliphilus hydrothermalis TaxID=1482730 RepID=A0ABS2NM54_9FIRM|nr:Xaa-Pro peptidase family protein [Alkaliphilus hydrothermalis]MBM7613992.1 Xaa-Pro aminopeptidase [Alkaliphilus hydrothermalis]
MEMRVNKVRNLLDEKNLDAILLYKPENRRYIAGFTGSNGYILITKEKAIFITDFRYTIQASEQCQGFEIVEMNNHNPLSDVLKSYSLKRLGIEEEHVSYGQFLEFSEKLPEVEFVPLKGTLTTIRSIKTEDEIELIAKAAEITDEAFEHIMKYIKPGMKETEVALELEVFMKKKGASALSFESIVASGVRSSLPHGKASDKVIEKGDMITLDFGCVYKGYCSDMTRSFVMGEATDKQKEIYYGVLEAQEASLKAVRPGITGIELDKIARDIITEKGYGENFRHGLGHGVGIEVHELPHVNARGTVAMEPGAVITIEPGIYVPHYGGVRIEDLVVVTEDGYRVLSKSTKELIELKL